MVKSIQSHFEDYQSRRLKEVATRAILRDLGAPDVVDLTFRKQSHNAVVFTGQLDGGDIFLKQYETDHGSTLVRNGVQETRTVRAHMDGVTAGVADIVWSDETAKLVLMAAVPGTPVSDALSAGHAPRVMPQVARWLSHYIGPRGFDDRFSPGHWIKMRAKEDMTALSPDDQNRFTALLDVQRARHARHGILPTRKGHFPTDFAPHNLHWTGDAIWGFDVEGYRTNPIARAVAKFCVLATRRLPNDSARRFGVHKVCLDAFEDALDLSGDPPELMPFLIADELLSGLLRRHNDSAVAPVLRAAIDAHLAQT